MHTTIRHMQGALALPYILTWLELSAAGTQPLLWAIVGYCGLTYL